MDFAAVEKARAALHEKRQSIYKKGGIAVLMIVFFALFFRISGMMTGFFIFFLAFFVLMITVVIASFATTKEYEAYKQAYKAYFVASSLNNVFTDIHYEHQSGFPKQTVAAVMDTADRYRSNDLLTATYKNIRFTQADVHTEERHTSTDSNGQTHTYYETIFKGRFLIFDFDRNFSFSLQVSSKGFHGEVLPRSASERKFQRITTESNEFNRKFYIYAQDGVDALYILDPAFMEKIQQLYEDCKHDLLLTFMDKKVYIAIDDHEDSFEPPARISQPLDERAELAKIQQDIKVITNFVDGLRLDRYFKGATK